MAGTGGSISTGTTQLVRVYIPDCKTQKCLVLDMAGTVWDAKQVILDKVYKELPRDSLNYGLYLLPSVTGKLGKFMDDSLLLSDYALKGSLPKLEMRYKHRDYSKHVSLTEKNIIRVNSKTNQKRLLENIGASSYRKIDKLLDSGLDPNFVTDDGNTPLGLACGRGRSVQCIQSLLSSGAHIDFRGKDGLTPLHRAAIGGNALAINSLLSYGASPNYRDLKGLTPVYHTAIMGDDTGACVTLLRNRAELGIKDQGGWSELHHTSKYGHIQHAELFIRYGADINDQNLVGNTPLHVAASHGQREFALMLLKRGADKTKVNFAGQTPSQVSILCGHHQLATEINNFSLEQVEHIKLPADYNQDARKFGSQETYSVLVHKPSLKDLADTLYKDKNDTLHHLPQLKSISNIGYRDSVSSHTSSQRMADTESLNSVDLGSTHSDSSTPGPSTPQNRKQSFGQQRERLYRAGPGRYVTIQDVEPQQPGDIALRRGMAVEVTYIGKGGYWEGKVGGAEGWFPRLAIKEMDEDQFDYHTETPPPTPPYVKPEAVIPVSTPSAIASKRMTNIQEVVVYRGNRGYGFAMRGVRATKTMQFQPSPEVPALQYIGSVEENGAAAEAGLKAGDFLIEVNGHNVTHSTHDDVVEIVRKARDSLRIKVITPLIKPKSVSQHLQKQITPLSTPESTRKEQIVKESPPTNFKASTDRETIIGESPPSSDTLVPIPTKIPTIGRTHSPLPAIGPSGWDSSQDDHEDLSAPGILRQVNPKPPFMKSYTSDVLYPPATVAEDKSQTIPVLPKKDYPQQLYNTTCFNAEEEPEAEESNLSAFELELRKGKAKIDKKSSISPDLRKKSNSVSDKGSPLLSKKEPSVGMNQQILQASRARMQRADSNQLRMSPYHSPKDPWRKAMKMIAEPVTSTSTVDSEETESSSEEPISPFRTQLRSVKKAPPPVVKPKPKKANSDESPPPPSPGVAKWRPYVKPTSNSPLLHRKQAPPTVEPDILPKPLSPTNSMDFELIPPLTSDEKRPNSFIDVAPPEGFSIPGFEVNESSTDEIIPPPLPQSSPPPSSDKRESGFFILPENSPPPIRTSSPVGIPPSKSIDKLPSPMPSPPNRSGLLDLSNPVVPPPAFEDMSSWRPDSDDMPPPIPNEPPPLSDVDEDLRNDGSNNCANRDMDTFLPHLSLLTVVSSPTPTHEEKAMDNSVAPESPPPKPITGFSNQPHSIDQTSTKLSQPAIKTMPEIDQTIITETAEAAYKNKPVIEWEIVDVCQWLKDIGFAEYTESFEENEIVGEHLVDLSREDLKELGVKKIGHQKKFQSKLSTLTK